MDEYWLSLVGIAIAAGSLLVAIIALYKSNRAQKEANSIQQRLVEIEEKREAERAYQATKARLRPYLSKVDKSNYRLYISNDGMSEARNVRVVIDGKPFNQHCSSIHGYTIPAFIGARSEVSCPLGLNLQCAPPFDIELIWEDDSGEKGIFRGALTF